MNNIGLLCIILLLAIVIYLVISCHTKEEFEQVNDIQVPSYTDTSAPYIPPFIMHDVLTLQECQNIINHCQDKLSDSKILSGVEKNVRNSQQCWIPKNHQMVKHIYKKFAEIFQIPMESAEDLQVVRYLPGQYFNEHHDACCDDNVYCKKFLKGAGQRILTVLIYLNDDFEGGYTQFPNLKTKLKVKPGDAIVFFPVAYQTNQCHPYALHAGTSVTKGTKWVANIWFHERKYESPI
jgi:prolyl 4-hydroxylase